MSGSERPLRFVLRHSDRRAVAWLLALMTGVSLTEGVGVLTLLPVLGGMQGGGGRWAGWIERTLGFMPSLPLLLVVMTMLAALRTALAYGRQVVAAEIQNGVVDRLRLLAFDAVLHAEWRQLVRTQSSDHANLILLNVARVGMGLNQLLAAVALGIAAGGYVIAALLLSWRVALVTVALGGVVLALFATHRAHAARHGEAVGEGWRRLHAFVNQALGGIRIIKAHAIEDRRTAGFAQTVNAVRGAVMANERMHARGQALLQLGSAITLALMLGVGHLTFGVSLPVLLPLLLAFARLAPMLGAVQSSWATWRHQRPAVDEVQAFLTQMSDVREPASAALPDISPRQAIRLDRVRVDYAAGAGPALEDVSLTLPVNSTTALCGTSGAGKSTLADLLMGLLAPDAGRLFVDDVPIDGAARIAWRRSVAYVQQDAFLFHDTVHANVLLGRDEDEAAVEAALRRAGAGFVFDLPDGMDTVVGDAGARLSGGERQRVALARALLGSPALLILDEATSALDPENERLVRETMAALRGQVTVVFITHRASMRGDADQVVTLDRGRVV